MANKPNWNRTKKQMYKSVEKCHPIISDTSDIRDEKKEKRAEHIKEFLLIMAALGLFGLSAFGIMSLLRDIYYRGGVIIDHDSTT